MAPPASLPSALPVRIDSPGGRAVLDAIAVGGGIFVFDFDGTLAPLIADPAAVRLPGRTARLLARLAALRRVYVLSGRPAADVASRLPAAPIAVIGHHGAEHGDAGGPSMSHAHARWAVQAASWIEQLHRGLAVLPATERPRIEPKPLGLSLHWRDVDDRARAHRHAVRAARALAPQARLIGGRFVLNLVPPDAPDKADALRRIALNHPGRPMLFVGDDTTDEIAFAGAPPQVRTIRIGHARRTAAHFLLSRRTGIDWLLARGCAAAADGTPG